MGLSGKVWKEERKQGQKDYKKGEGSKEGGKRVYSSGP
jgi:hypothetical protein